MPAVTEIECRAYGMTDAQIESMKAQGFFAVQSPRAELRDDIRSEIEEIDADLEGMLTELADVKARIAAAKGRRTELAARYRAV